MAALAQASSQIISQASCSLGESTCLSSKASTSSSSLLALKAHTSFKSSKVALRQPLHALPARPVVAVSAEAASTDKEAKEQKATSYHFVVANAKFMLDEEEHFQEQLKERLRWLAEKGIEQNFWLVYEPSFLEEFPDLTKKLGRPAVALVSTDATWITFMKLRLDRVLRGDFECDSKEEALLSKPFVNDVKPANWIAPYPKYEAGWWKPYASPYVVNQN